VIGHRGGAALGPENTLAAIAAGLAAGADGVEVDARRTTDGAVVLMHDPDLDRTTDGAGRIDGSTLADVRALDAAHRFTGEGDGARGTGVVVPTLEEALDLVSSDRLLVVEVRGHPWEAGYDPAEPVAHAVAALLGGRGGRRLVASSFDPFALQVIRENAPGVRTAVLTSPAFDLASNLAAAVAGDHEECHVPAVLVEESFVREAHAAGRRVVAWTVDDPERVRALASWGVDGVITDDPRMALRALRRAG
jgi:glycerophosphoryl diester phosphodiesterase